MIYILFGPPGVGKSYIGKLVSEQLGIFFFDGDELIDSKEKKLLQTGNYDQVDRDRFVNRLRIKVDEIFKLKIKDAIVAEAFTKEKNRMEFILRYDGNIKFILVAAPNYLAKERVFDLYPRENHAINERGFQQIWNEFDLPMMSHEVITNINNTDEELIQRFKQVVKY
jgi:gluconate kinase